MRARQTAEVGLGTAYTIYWALLDWLQAPQTVVQEVYILDGNASIDFGTAT